jgi:hypothetical protein
MMTDKEVFTMYQNKKAFVDSISKAFQLRPKTHSIESIQYELFTKQINNELVTNYTYYQEYLVVTFNGGGISVRSINGNSDTANFREIGKLIDGGYYDEVELYTSMEERGFTRVAL